MTDTGIQDRAGAAADTAKEQAGEVAGTAKEQAGAVASAATEQARAVASDAKDQARHLVENGRQQLREQAQEQTARAASSLRDLGRQLEQMAQAPTASQGPVVDVTRQAADGVQRLAQTLESKRPEEVLEDVKRFARQRPGMFVLGALGAGFLAGRLLRTVDTAAIKDAVSGNGREAVSGPGRLAELRGAGELGTGDAMAAGMVGTTPADLVDPPTAAIPTYPPRTAPRHARDTGSEA
jgi:hypothetical protein